MLTTFNSNSKEMIRSATAAKRTASIGVRCFRLQSPALAKSGGGGGFFGNWFGGKKDKEDTLASDDTQVAVGDKVEGSEPTQEEMAAKRLENRLANMSNHEPIYPKFPKRQPFSPKRLETRVKQVLRQCEITLDTSDWKATKLEDREIKFKVLSAVIEYIKLPIPSRSLNNISNVGDLLVELVQKPVQADAGHPVAQYFKEHADELPPNMKFEPYATRTRKIHSRQ